MKRTTNSSMAGNQLQSDPSQLTPEQMAQLVKEEKLKQLGEATERMAFLFQALMGGYQSRSFEGQLLVEMVATISRSAKELSVIAQDLRGEFDPNHDSHES